MEAHSVLCADAALVSCHLFEYEVVVEFCARLQDYVHVEVSIPDVAVTQHQGFRLFPKVIQQARPLPHIK